MSSSDSDEEGFIEDPFILLSCDTVHDFKQMQKTIFKHLVHKDTSDLKENALFAIHNERGLQYGILKKSFCTSNRFSECGENNNIATLSKSDSAVKEFIQTLENGLDITLPDRVIHRFNRKHVKESKNTMLEILITVFASCNKLGPNVYGIMKSDKISYLLEKGTCNLSVILLKLSTEDIQHFAALTKNLLDKLANAGLVLLDLKSDNIIYTEDNQQLLAIDFDPLFTYILPYTNVGMTYCINFSILFGYIRTFISPRNKFIQYYIALLRTDVSNNMKMWKDTGAECAIRHLLRKKFLIADEDIIKKTTETFKTDIENNIEDIFVSNKEFNKNTSAILTTFSAFNKNSMCLSMITSSLPANWSVSTVGNNFSFTNTSLDLTIGEYPPYFENENEQLSWYTKVMIDKHKIAKKHEKNKLIVKLFDTLCSKNNIWFLKENLYICDIFIRELIRYRCTDFHWKEKNLRLLNEIRGKNTEK